MTDLRNGTCPLCRHNEVVEGTPLEFDDTQIPNRLGVAHEPIPDGWIMKGRFHRSVVFGELRTYTCRSCGYTQWFALSPDTIPIGDQHGTRVIQGPSSATPYR